MQINIKKYLSIFLLLVFVYPFLEKGIHDFEHLNDFHCSAQSEKHLHEQEHNCAICDFNVPVSNKLSESNFDLVLSETSAFYSDYCTNVAIPVADYQLPSRAPPVV